MGVRHIIPAMALLIATPAFAETLTNTSIISLVKSGVGDEVIVAVIERSEVRFDLSTDQIIALKRQGVTPVVLTAMIKANDGGSGRPATASRTGEADRPAASGTNAPVSLASIRTPGVYLATGSKLTRIDASASSQLKTGGLLGSALTGGIVSASMKAVISGASARTRTSDANPIFYFYFGSGNQDGSGWAAAGTPTSPNEFSFVRLTAKGGRREAKVGKMGITGAKVGVMDKDRIDFTYDEVRPGLFLVKPSTPLVPGEYAFIATMGAGGATSARIFDFAVQ